MEKIGCICMMSGLVKAMAALENSLMDIHGLSLNEAVVLCCIGDSEVSAGAVADSTGLKPSHISKILKGLEAGGLVARALGSEDRRQMYFSLTPEGRGRLEKLRTRQIPIPALLAPLTAGPSPSAPSLPGQ